MFAGQDQGALASESQSKDNQGSRSVKPAASWQNRLAGTSMQKNWEAFKNRNPNTVQQVLFPGILDFNPLAANLEILCKGERSFLTCRQYMRV